MTLRNSDRFSKVFHCRTQHKILYIVIVPYPVYLKNLAALHCDCETVMCICKKT